MDEVQRNIDKVGLRKKDIKRIVEIFQRICSEPKKSTVLSFYKLIVDCGDAHVLASAKEEKAEFLVSLDKKHILILRNKIRKVKIVSPADLIKRLS